MALWFGTQLRETAKNAVDFSKHAKNGCTLQFERVPHRLPSVPTGGWEKHGRDGIPCASNLSIKGGQRSTDLGTATSTAWDLNKKGP